MRFVIYLLSGFYGIFCMWCNFATVEALIGENVRSAGESEFPFIVAIIKTIYENNMQRNYKCAGTLISRKDVLTSEHCLTSEYLARIHVLVGSSYLNRTVRHYPLWWTTYDQWAVYSFRDLEFPTNDIGILNLLEHVPDSLQPAHIAICTITSLYGAEVQVSGWGYIRNRESPNILQTATVTATKKEICELRASRIAGQNLVMDERTICSISNPYVLLTNGDSGGPLLHMNLIVGVNHGVSPLLSNDFNSEEILWH
ncbi:PREDICTED: trypsin theta-like [Ceratosolen solmsi marchali]|uniref:Trypsin theta-like n=1 Tax=Ceratosolen solmsi marchali TaxID=326594 RepID=A0AAJ7DY27_9HYME|nr:PREDICTED: trypsin theta-like [Ceratosolen solmsi marchali]